MNEGLVEHNHTQSTLIGERKAADLVQRGEKWESPDEEAIKIRY